MDRFYEEQAKRLPIRQFDVLVAGGGTAGVVAAIAAARQGQKTALVESKGYVGGTVVEGGTALHSYFNLWKAFPGVTKRRVVAGIPEEIVQRLSEVGGTSGHAEMVLGYDYDSICTAIDTEIYKFVAFTMLREAGVEVFVNSFLAGAATENGHVKGAIVESRSGREAFFAKSFVDCTGYGDLCAAAGASFTEPNDYQVANSIGVGGVNVEAFRKFMDDYGMLKELSFGRRSGEEGKIVRLAASASKLPQDFVQEAHKIGMSLVTTTVQDDYFMFIKFNVSLTKSPTDRDAVAWGELELRRRQMRGIELLRQTIPGCEKAFIARTSPSLCIRRGRVIACDYDISLEDVLEGRHFADDIMAYGFHDCAPRLQIRDGGTYGIPYRALLVSGVGNLWAAGMLITSDHDAHMSTRNTVCCMGQGQGAGTAAALCAGLGIGSRELPYEKLRTQLLADGVILENGGEHALIEKW